MKVVIVGPFYPFRGGIAHFGGCLSNELRQQGHQTTLINFLNQYPQLIFPGSSQYEKDSYFSGLSSIRTLTPYNPLSYYPTLLKIQDSHPDLVIFNYFIPFLAPAYIYLIKKLRNKGIKSVVIVHNVASHEKWLLGNTLTRQMLKSVDLVFTLSESVFQDAKSLLNCRTANLKKLYHPLYDFFNRGKYTKEEAKAKLNLENKKVMLFFGYIKPYKGLDILLKSFPFIKKKISNLSLLIVGEIYGDKKYYQELIEKSGYKNDIIMNNEYIANDDVEIYFKATDLLVLPYINATQSGVIQIAYSCLCGVVVTPVGGLPEMVIPQKTGIISRSINEIDIANAIYEYFSLNSPQIVNHIKSYKEQYSWERFVKIFISEYKKHFRLD